PIMDVYARLFYVRVNKGESEKSIETNIAELIKMARRDKYIDYRDIIYYMAAQMELERNNPDGALALLLKSTQVSSNNAAQRNKAFLQLAELSFTKKQYRKASDFYDSLQLDDPSLKNVDALIARRDLLQKVAANIEIIERQDSLQKIALLPENELNDFVKKLVRQLRKQQGLKDEGTATASAVFASNNEPTTLFPSVQAKGEWYFYNASFRTKVQSDFKSKWGNRPNVDNWRRSETIAAGLQSKINLINGAATDDGNNENNNAPTDITYETLYGNLPLTPQQLQKSNDSIQNALFSLGKLYVQDIEDCIAGTATLEELQSRFPKYEKMDEVLFNLYFCYNKNGEVSKATGIKKQMQENNPGSNFTSIVTTGKDPQLSAKQEATKKYEGIYDLFIEGNFNEAVAQKKAADSLYGKNYWTPQLLYIEAVYYIKQRDDSTAKNILNNIISQFSGTPLADKATTLLDVLGRRNQIEEELRNLVITKRPEDTVAKRPEIIINIPKAIDTVTTTKIQSVKTITPAITDTLKTLPPQKIAAPPYAYNPETPQYVVLILNKVDPVFSNEAKNAFFRYNRETYYNKIMSADLFELDADNRLLFISPFKNVQEAIDYIDKTRPKTATEIIPWLKGGKYSFSIISEKNIDVLKANKDLESYKKFLNQNLPDRF
ncbi:MAG: hypothetical protein ABUT20_35360, partial [Bacteroidota bacterium]